MSRIAIPATIEASPEASQPLLQAVQKQLGVVPNLFRLIGTNPAVLEGHLSLAGALAKGALSLATRERIALAIAQFNSCNYCLSAHSYIAKNMAKLEESEITANRKGASSDPKAEAAIGFALEVADKRGQVSDQALEAVRNAGHSEAEIIEIVIHVALNIWTNYIYGVVHTDIDFPLVQASQL